MLRSFTTVLITCLFIFDTLPVNALKLYFIRFGVDIIDLVARSFSSVSLCSFFLFTPISLKAFPPEIYAVLILGLRAWRNETREIFKSIQLCFKRITSKVSFRVIFHYKASFQYPNAQT